MYLDLDLVLVIAGFLIAYPEFWLSNNTIVSNIMYIKNHHKQASRGLFICDKKLREIESANHNNNSNNAKLN
ncbi:unnamed protein product [Rhizophagus irregularis]|uniref:Uncharacterized protein n=1 Tax=Rhizophagus irregularis TaxID=588596 RepID=A0A915YMV9_9GLOM|nr:unnamed protein product [Rhizophagus irregularis]CAB5294824.1 unnamed protein product [Rhizophagus irregularis]CAB5361614.1 unnamed protein product [Rhizophagus irregularis]